MKARNISRIVIVTTVLATFVLHLCAGVSKLTPFFFVAALLVCLTACALPQFSPFAAILLYTQKRE
jgi:hypothetical protein